MRVLVTTNAGRGHYHPMLPLARAIAARGHDLAVGRRPTRHASGWGPAEGATSADMIERLPECSRWRSPSARTSPSRRSSGRRARHGSPAPGILLTCGGEEMTSLWREHGLQEPHHAGIYEHPYLDATWISTCSSPSDRVGAQPDNVDVRDYVPQDETLARAAAVVSHAGSGTFLAALATGCRSSRCRRTQTSS